MKNYWWNKPVHSALQLVSGPAVEPVDLTAAKLQCRVDPDMTADDTLISSLIVAARQYCENYTKRAFITQTWCLYMDAFPFWRQWSLIGSPITLALPPLQSVSWVMYYDTAGNAQTIDSSLYSVDDASEPGRIVRFDAQPWPVTGFINNAVAIQFMAGYGDSGAAVPQTINQAILMQVAHYYRSREAVGDFGSECPMGVKALLDSVSYGGAW